MIECASMPAVVLLFVAFTLLLAGIDGEQAHPGHEVPKFGVANSGDDKSYNVIFYQPVNGTVLDCSMPCGECLSMVATLHFDPPTTSTLDLLFDDTDIITQQQLGGPKGDAPNTGRYGPIGGYLHVPISLEDREPDGEFIKLTARVTEISTGAVTDTSVTFQLRPVHTDITFMRRVFVSFVPEEIRSEHRKLASTATAFGGFEEISLMRPSDVPAEFVQKHKLTMCKATTDVSGDDTSALSVQNDFIRSLEPWKAYIVRERLRDMREGDVLMYGDPGVTWTDLAVDLCETAVKHTGGVLTFPASDASGAFIMGKNGSTAPRSLSYFVVAATDEGRAFVDEWISASVDSTQLGDATNALTLVANKRGAPIYRDPSPRGLHTSQSGLPGKYGTPLVTLPEDHADDHAWSAYCFRRMRVPSGAR